MPRLDIPYVYPQQPLDQLAQTIFQGFQMKRQKEEQDLEREALQLRLSQMKQAQKQAEIEARAREYDDQNKAAMQAFGLLDKTNPTNMGPPTGADAGMMGMPDFMGAQAPPQEMGEHPLLSILNPRTGGVLGQARPRTAVQFKAEQAEADALRTRQIEEEAVARARGAFKGQGMIPITPDMDPTLLTEAEKAQGYVNKIILEARVRARPKSTSTGGSTLAERIAGLPPDKQKAIIDVQAKLRQAGASGRPEYGGQPRLFEDPETGERVFMDANGSRYRVPAGFRLVGDDAPSGFTTQVAASDALFKLIDHAGEMLTDPKYAGLTGPLKGRIGDIQMSAFGGLGLTPEQLELYPTLDKYLAEEVFGKGGKQLTVNETQIIRKYLPNKNDTLEAAINKLAQAERELADQQTSRLKSRPLNEIQGMPGYEEYLNRATNLRWYKGGAKPKGGSAPKGKSRFTIVEEK